MPIDDTFVYAAPFPDDETRPRPIIPAKTPQAKDELGFVRDDGLEVLDAIRLYLACRTRKHGPTVVSCERMTKKDVRKKVRELLVIQRRPNREVPLVIRRNNNRWNLETSPDGTPATLATLSSASPVEHPTRTPGKTS